MVIAVPTGIKIFSWLSKSFSKTDMTKNKQNLITFNSYLLHKHTINYRYLSLNNSINTVNGKNVVLYGENCSSTIDYKYDSILKSIQEIPRTHMSILIGILLSDAHLSKGTNINSRLQFKQSLKNINYFYFVYSKLNHYCFKGAYLT
jgi:hypothetical protein